MDSPEPVQPPETLGSQDTGRRQTKQKKTINTTQKTKKYEQHVPYQTTICEPWCSKGVSSS